LNQFCEKPLHITFKTGKGREFKFGKAVEYEKSPQTVARSDSCDLFNFGATILSSVRISSMVP